MKSDPKPRQSREAWEDYNERQKFEHQLIDRKTNWMLTTQAILFTAYGVTFRGAIDADLANSFRTVVAWSGVAVAVISALGVLALLRSKRLSYVEYRNYFEGCFGDSPQKLPEPLDRQTLQWGVDTRNTWFTLVPDVLLPTVFVIGWLYLLVQ